MAKKNNVQAVQAEQIDKLAGFESAILAALKAGAIKAEQIDGIIAKAGFNVPESEHADARPINKADAAKAELLAFGVDVDALQAETAQAGNLAVNVASLASAFGKYGKHVYAADTANGTSLVTHEVARQILESGKCLLPEVLKAVRQHLPNYSSTGHYNTLKRMLKAEGYKLNVWQAGFGITGK